MNIAMKMLGRSAASAGVALLVCSGCVTQVSLSEPQNASEPNASEPATTILYTGVRSEVRRFPDYGSIDQSILASEQK